MSHDANVFLVDDVEWECSSGAVQCGTVMVRCLAPKEVNRASRANWNATIRLSHGRLVQLCSSAAKRHGLLVHSRAAHHAVALLRLALSHLQGAVQKSVNAGTTRTSVCTRTAPALFSTERDTSSKRSSNSRGPPCLAPGNIEDAFLVQRRAAVFCGRWMRDVPCEARQHLANLCTTFDLVSAERILEERCLRPPSWRFITRSVMMSTWSSDRATQLKKKKGFQVRYLLLVVVLQETSRPGTHKVSELLGARLAAVCSRFAPHLASQVNSRALRPDGRSSSAFFGVFC